MQGSLNAAIFSDRGAVRNIELTPKGQSARLEHGTTYQIVVTNPHDIGERIRKVRLLIGLKRYFYKQNDIIGGTPLVPRNERPRAKNVLYTVMVQRSLVREIDTS